MSVFESGKKIVEKITGWPRPASDDLARFLNSRKANTFQFKDDGFIPNCACWPLIVYRSVIKLPEEIDPASIFKDIFQRNGWGNSWRNGIYDYAHYHSRIHEVLGVTTRS